MLLSRVQLTKRHFKDIRREGTDDDTDHSKARAKRGQPLQDLCGTKRRCAHRAGAAPPTLHPQKAETSRELGLHLKIHMLLLSIFYI